jgi:glycosyltransferase involved in cell wall biosynthesis
MQQRTQLAPHAAWQPGARRPVLLHLIPSFEGGGAERQFALLLPALAARGFVVHAGFLRDGPNQDRLAYDGILLHQIAHRGNYDPLLSWRVYRLIGAVQPDVVHTWLPMMDVLGGGTALLRSVPWIMSERSSPEHSQLRLPRERVRHYIGARAHAVVANSENGRAYWAARAGDDRSHFVPNAVPLDEIDAASPLDRASLGLNTELPLVVYAGRFAEEKNVCIVLEALLRVTADGNAVAVLCGEGPEGDVLRRRVAVQGAADRVAILPYQTELWRLFKAAAVVLSLSRYEGMPNVVVEAMACGTPLVVSDIAAHRSVLDRDSALFVDGSSVAETADALNRVLTGLDAARCRALRARQRAGAWSLDAHADAMTAIYSRVAGVHVRA